MNFINNLSIYKNFKQHTLNKKIYFSGVGVHNGRAVSMSVEPAKINTGIVFKRTDIPNAMGTSIFKILCFKPL